MVEVAVEIFWWRVPALIHVPQKLRWLVRAARAPPRPTPFRGTSPSLAEPGDRGSLGNSSTDIGSGVVVVPAVAFFPSAVAYLMCWQRLRLDGLAEPGHTNARNQSSGFRYT